MSPVNAAPSNKKPKIMFLAGEASGDLHGASLVKAVLRQCPGAQVFGLGGPQMQAAGMRLDLDLASRSVIGFWEVLKHFAFFRKAFSLAQDLLAREKPDLVVPIDYPGFNLRFSKFAHSQGFKVCYYISPQVWAWKAGRVYSMKQFLKKILVTFPFEVPFYQRAGLACRFVGHPLLDLVAPKEKVAAVRKRHGWGNEDRVIGLLPGSRVQEVEWLLPVMLRASQRLAERDPGLRFAVLKAQALNKQLFEDAVSRYAGRLKLQVIEAGENENPYDLRRCFSAALVASGTATLETALLGTPFVILYRVHPISYFLGKKFIKIPYIGLANVVAGAKVVPEFIQDDLDPWAIAHELWQLLEDRQRRESQLKALKKAVTSLGQPGAAQRAAEEVLKLARGQA